MYKWSHSTVYLDVIAYYCSKLNCLSKLGPGKVSQVLQGWLHSILKQKEFKDKTWPESGYKKIYCRCSPHNLCWSNMCTYIMELLHRMVWLLCLSSWVSGSPWGQDIEGMLVRRSDRNPIIKRWHCRMTKPTNNIKDPFIDSVPVDWVGLCEDLFICMWAAVRHQIDLGIKDPRFTGILTYNADLQVS